MPSLDGSSLAITPDGYYDASSEKAEENLNVRVGTRVFAIASYRDKFYRPDVVKLSLAGKSLSELGLAGIDSVKVAPIVELVDVPHTVGESKLTVNLRLTDGGGGIGEVRLFVNGSAVVQDNADACRCRRCAARAATRCSSPTGPMCCKRRPTMPTTACTATSAIVKIVGKPAAGQSLPICMPSWSASSEFGNPNLNLVYPVEDAKLFAKTLTKYSASLFQKVDIKALDQARGDDARRADQKHQSYAVGRRPR